MQATSNTFVRNRLIKATDVLTHLWTHVGIQTDRAKTFVLAVLGQDFVANR